MIASDDINCDNAEAVGEVIQNALHNKCIEDAVIPRKAQVRTLQLLRLGVKMGQRHRSEANDTVQKWDDAKKWKVSSKEPLT